jgi:ribonuclease E
MEEGRNDREVEKRLRDAVKNDRARVQIGKISQFGLMEMSRQRLRAGLVAGSTIACPHCAGTGLMRSVESSALRVLRALEEEGEKAKSASVAVKIPTEIAIYVLNQKRREVARLESEYRMDITFLPVAGMPAGEFEIERIKSRDPGERPKNNAVGIEAGFVHSDEPEPDYVEEADEEDEIEISQDADESEADGEAPEAKTEGQGRGEREGGREGGKRRRRGGRGRNRNRDGEAPRGDQPRGENQPRAEQAPRAEGVSADGEDAEASEGAADGAGQPQGEGEAGRRRRRRRGRRGGRDREQRPHDQETPFPPAEARFGVPDEVDTTPTHGGGPALNAPAAPVWSLSTDADDVDTTPQADGSKPTKKGWWQKAFGGE